MHTSAPHLPRLPSSPPFSALHTQVLLQMSHLKRLSLSLHCLSSTAQLELPPCVEALTVTGTRCVERAQSIPGSHVVYKKRLDTHRVWALLFLLYHSACILCPCPPPPSCIADMHRCSGIYVSRPVQLAWLERLPLGLRHLQGLILCLEMDR